MVYFQQAFLFCFSLYNAKSHNMPFIYYKITQRAVLCTPGLKALADTVCTERCIAFNGGTPHFLRFLPSGHEHAERDGHKTTSQTNGRRHWLCGKPQRRAQRGEGESW